MRLRAIILVGFGAATLLAANIGASWGQAMTEEAWSYAGLAGTFAGPAPGAPPGPAVLIVAGSGPTDRDGNNPSGLATDTYRMLAAGWAAAGIRSLRYDKRGVGASAGLMQREEDLRFDHYVDDAVAAVHDLSSRADVSSVVIAGHSEGGLIAILAAKKISVAGLALLAAPGRSIADLLREQFTARLPPELKPRAFGIIDTLAADGRVADVPSELALAFRPSVQPYLASMINIDPTKEFAQLKMPALMIYGARDLQVSLADRDVLAKVRPDAQVVTLLEANHIMKRAPADAPGNFKTYADRSLPLDPGVLPPLVDFVRKVAR